MVLLRSRYTRTSSPRRKRSLDAAAMGCGLAVSDADMAQTLLRMHAPTRPAALVCTARCARRSGRRQPSPASTMAKVNMWSTGHRAHDHLWLTAQVLHGGR